MTLAIVPISLSHLFGCRPEPLLEGLTVGELYRIDRLQFQMAEELVLRQQRDGHFAGIGERRGRRGGGRSPDGLGRRLWRHRGVGR